MQALFDRYDGVLAVHRQAFAERMQRLRTLATPESSAAFLMFFCAQGVGMTRDVPLWIHGAGEACIANGYASLGRMLLEHADHEQGHHELFERDAVSLVSWWNDRFETRLPLAAITGVPELTAVGDYRQLHLRLIDEAPFTQIAVEYEIERLSLDEGQRLIRAFVKELGVGVLPCLSFLKEHVAVDVGHTKLNRRAMTRFLAERPETLPQLIERGAAALDVYARFVEGCAGLALATVAAHGLTGARRRPRPLLASLREKAGAAAFLLRAAR